MSTPNAEICVTCDPSDSETVSAETTRVPNVEPEDVMNPATFIPPVLSGITPSVIIEFCDRVSQTIH